MNNERCNNVTEIFFFLTLDLYHLKNWKYLFKFLTVFTVDDTFDSFARRRVSRADK